MLWYFSCVRGYFSLFLTCFRFDLETAHRKTHMTHITFAHPILSLSLSLSLLLLIIFTLILPFLSALSISIFHCPLVPVLPNTSIHLYSLCRQRAVCCCDVTKQQHPLPRGHISHSPTMWASPPPH